MCRARPLGLSNRLRAPRHWLADSAACGSGAIAPKRRRSLVARGLCLEDGAIASFVAAPGPAFALHGGALAAARAAYPAAPAPWIDLSTGINPWPYPVGIVPQDAWTRLPEAPAQAALEAAAARRYGAPRHADVVAAPGTQAVIQQLPARLGGDDIRLLGVTYGEYATVFHAAGAAVRSVSTLDELAGADVAVVVNPNNPDGRLVPPAALAALAATVGTLVVDEAFMDALEGPHSMVPMLPERGTLVLRSFGKFYGLAGLRLGFAIATSDLAPALRASLGPWAIGGPALAIGTRALADDRWATATQSRLVEAAARLDSVLTAAGWTVLGGTPLFRLARHDQAAERFEALAEGGILTRPFGREPDRLRFGLPGTSDAWDRLAQDLGTAGAGRYGRVRS